MKKQLGSLLLALGLTAAAQAPAQAAPPVAVPATGLVETPDAVFFQPTQFPNVVWYFQKSTVTLTQVQPPLGGSSGWKAAVIFKKVTPEDLALLPQAWQGKSLVPYIVRPTVECALHRTPEMRAVVQEVRAANRDVSAANPPACRFSFRLPAPMPAEAQATLDELVASGALIERDLHIEVATSASVAWADVHRAVAHAIYPPIGTLPRPPLTLSEAQTAVEAALESPALAAVNAAVTPAEKQAFIEAALEGLFVDDPSDPSGTELQMVFPAPAGSFVYHQEIFSRGL